MTNRDRLIEILQDTLHEWECDVSIKTLTEITEHLIANGVIVPPCKVGDILYEICERRRNNKWEKVIAKRVVHGIEIGLNGSLCARCGTTITVFFSGLGKTVFLTREEAEKALEVMK